jgi:hypothetical protein
LSLVLDDLNVYNDQLFFLTLDGQIGVSTVCPSGMEPSNDQTPCSACSTGYYSFGIQSKCLKCSLKAELYANTTRESAIIDWLCQESDPITETVTDTIREIAEFSGIAMGSVTFILIVVGLCLLSATLLVCCFLAASA